MRQNAASHHLDCHFPERDVTAHQSVTGASSGSTRDVQPIRGEAEEVLTWRPAPRRNLSSGLWQLRSRHRGSRPFSRLRLERRGVSCEERTQTVASEHLLCSNEQLPRRIAVRGRVRRLTPIRMVRFWRATCLVEIVGSREPVTSSLCTPMHWGELYHFSPWPRYRSGTTVA
jgi:hypothetical protein